MTRTGIDPTPRTAPLRLRVFSVVFWGFVGVSSAALFPVAVLLWAATVAFDRRLLALHRFTCWWASLYTRLNPAWPVRIEGREHIARGATYMLVANHQSFLDILVLFRLFAHFKWVSKIEMFRIPCIGWNMTLNRYVKLKRGDKQSVAEMMQACERLLAEGNSIMMFPEGTRSADGRLKAFKPGAFALALAARVPIVPIVIEGTARALPKSGFVLQGYHPIRVRVLRPIPYETFARKTPEVLAAEVRGQFAHELGEPVPGSTPSRVVSIEAARYAESR
jgi:1-acyl-sn-glycerol-3-phosphate acyltransferase